MKTPQNGSAPRSKIRFAKAAFASVEAESFFVSRAYQTVAMAATPAAAAVTIVAGVPSSGS